MENKYKAEIAEYQQKLQNLQAEYDKLDSFRRDKERLEKEYRDIKARLLEKDVAHDAKIRQMEAEFEAYKKRTQEEMLKKLRDEQQKMIKLTDSHLEAVSCGNYLVINRKHIKLCKEMKN